jgi:large subunit ribosomal protein L17
MRHRRKVKKLGLAADHRKALLNNLFTSLLASERIKTTQTRGRELIRFGNKLIEKAKRGDLASKRSVSSHITNKEVSKNFFKETLPKLASRTGGHIRLMKLGTRRGDGASMVLVELILEEKEKKKKTAKG